MHTGIRSISCRLEGDRVVELFSPQGPDKVEGDDFATGGLHVYTPHSVKTIGYTLSVTCRLQTIERHKFSRRLECLMQTWTLRFFLKFGKR